MQDDLSNAQIALLCEIGEQDLSKAADDKRRDLQRLLAEGYAEPTGQPAPALQLTAKGSAFLGARGVGVNEA
jgi:hypothetical protein